MLAYLGKAVQAALLKAKYRHTSGMEMISEPNALKKWICGTAASTGGTGRHKYKVRMDE